MNMLLDSHALLWFLAGDKRFGNRALQALNNPANRCFYSPISIWELAIKVSIGKLTLHVSFDTFVDSIASQSGLILLPLLPEHIKAVAKLAFHHRDPFDRMLIAQAQSEGMAFISADSIVDQYAIPRLW